MAADLHPDYASTHLAERWWAGGAAPVRVQHHHAHIASVMAEHRLRGRVIGVAFDGTGFGEDGTIWGGELLLCDETGYERAGHLAPVVQPGGDRCAREGWRMAIAYLHAAGLRRRASIPAWFRARRRVTGRAALAPGRPARRRGRSPAAPARAPAPAASSTPSPACSGSPTTRASRRRRRCASRRWPGRVPRGSVDAIPVQRTGAPLVLDTPALVAALVDQLPRGTGRRRARRRLPREPGGRRGGGLRGARPAPPGSRRVALSGGVFQNALLLARTSALLRERGLDVYTNHAVPANDGGVSLGQAFVAASRGAARPRGWA